MGERWIWHENSEKPPTDCYYNISGKGIDYWTEAKFHKEEIREHWKTTTRWEVPDVKNQHAINNPDRMTKEILVRIMRMVIQSIKSQS